MATANDIVRKQGDTYPIEATVLNAEGSAYDLSAVTEIKLGVAREQVLNASDTPLFVIDGAVTSAIDGKVEFPVSLAEAGVGVGSYFAEIQFIESTFIVTTQTFTYQVCGQIII